ncbi:hypothetical protein BJ170DRAFT_597980 [Xylariales sp. AK1849]|nr:hypothetical protein BJ170DRAFT_597980 [Xylariales sp. AK1849]
MAVHRIVIEDRNGEKVATGAETVDGCRYHARREVIVSCGAYRSSQLLLLSGNGPGDDSSYNHTTQKVESRNHYLAGPGFPTRIALRLDCIDIRASQGSEHEKEGRMPRDQDNSLLESPIKGVEIPLDGTYTIKIARSPEMDATPVVTEEVPQSGCPVLSPETTDSEIDEQAKVAGQTFYHPEGGASIGSVVDFKCKVEGIQRLRVVDGSMFPVPINAHYQVMTYVVAEQAASMIIT